MIVYQFYVEDVEQNQWLYTTLELAKLCAEKSATDSLKELYGNNVSITFVWKRESEIRLTQEAIGLGAKPPEVEIEDERLYWRVGIMDEESTAYIVGPVEVYENVNF